MYVERDACFCECTGSSEFEKVSTLLAARLNKENMFA